MSQAFDHILQQLDRISPQEEHALLELLEVRLATTNGTKSVAHPQDKDAVGDPLAGLRVSTGIENLSEHFDDYRFGRQSR